MHWLLVFLFVPYVDPLRDYRWLERYDGAQGVLR